MVETSNYPSEFSPEARDRIEREKIRAYRELLPSTAYGFNEQNLAIPCIMQIFLAFAKEACAIRKERGWTIERIERESKEFLRRLTITVVFDKFPGLDRHWISNWNGSIDSNVERRLKESAKWKEYEELLLSTPASVPPGDSVEEMLERGSAALKAWQRVREPSSEEAARKGRLDEFEKKLHETAMGVLDRQSGIRSSSAPAKSLRESQPRETFATEESESANRQHHEKQIPTSQPTDQNLRDAILRKNARIVEIENSLDRPQEEASRLRLGEDREHLVVEVEKLEAELRKASVDRAIASRKRRESLGMPEGSRHPNTPVLDAHKSRSVLGINPSDLENLRRAVRIKFFDEARLPRDVEVEWETVLSSRKIPDSSVDLELTLALTKEYEKAISRACAQLAAFVAVTAVSRIGQPHFREAIWRECLDFGYELGQWNRYAAWVDKVAGIRWKAPVTADGATDREQLEKAAKSRREFFEGRIGMYGQDWLSAIDRELELRRTVSALPTADAEEQRKGMALAQAKAETAEGKSKNAASRSISPTPSKKRDPEVAKRRALVKSNPGDSVFELCQIFHRENVPLPARWQTAGLRTWVEAHRKYPTRIKVIVSKDRRSD